MNPTYTTHLMCAPELDTLATVKTIHVQSAERVETDALLIQLSVSDMVLDIRATEAGIVGEILVSEHESISSHDLLLTMEIEEPEFGFFGIPEQELSLPAACLIPTKLPTITTDQSHKTLQILPESARLAARLGVDLADVPAGPDGMVDDEAIEQYVRSILLRWRKLRNLIMD